MTDIAGLYKLLKSPDGENIGRVLIENPPKPPEDRGQGRKTNHVISDNVILDTEKASKSPHDKEN